MTSDLIAETDLVTTAKIDFADNRRAIKDAKNRLQWPYITHFAGAPSHRLLPRQFLHRFGDQLGKHAHRIGSQLLNDGVQKSPFIGLALFDFSAVRQRAFEAVYRFLWRVGAGPSAFFTDIRLLFRQTVNDERQPAWRGEGLGRRKLQSRFF